jgi:hypothetical protein
VTYLDQAREKQQSSLRGSMSRCTTLILALKLEPIGSDQISQSKVLCPSGCAGTPQGWRIAIVIYVSAADVPLPRQTRNMVEAIGTIARLLALMAGSEGVQR